MSHGRTWTTAAVGPAAAGIGLATWVATMATAPRYSDGPDQDMGELTLYVVVLLVAALGIGVVAPTGARLAGALLGMPGLVLSPWTAPRGDDDGLWLLIVPELMVFVAVLIATAQVASWMRSWSSRGCR